MGDRILSKVHILIMNLFHGKGQRLDNEFLYEGSFAELLDSNLYQKNNKDEGEDDHIAQYYTETDKERTLYEEAMERKKADRETALRNFYEALTTGKVTDTERVMNYFVKALDDTQTAHVENYRANICLDERNKVISKLSHHIKNLNATVREPLENLRNQPGVPENILEDALRGTNLIRNIVNAMNLSIGGAKEDFIFDATHLDDESVSLESIIWSALFSAIPNMFDGKHFSKFLRNYFPARETFREAQSAWSEASASGDRTQKIECLKHHFFDLSVEISGAPELIFGDTKGSATKMLILCQEIMMNAVKYASTIEREKRDLRIVVAQNSTTISIAVENSCQTETRLKTAGLGHTVIKNFATILGCKPQIEKTKDRYLLSLEFDNFSNIKQGSDS